MAGRLIGAWNPAEDDQGLAISGSQLVTYAAGTTTPKATFTTPALNVPQTNPVVADAAGRFPELWAADGALYDLVWKTAGGVIIKTFASIQTLGSAVTGAVMRDFGADGRMNLEARGGTFYIEAGDPTPDNTGGKMRLGGWSGTKADLITIDSAAVEFTGSVAGLASRSYLAGLNVSMAASSSTFTIGGGQATDSLGAAVMALSAPLAKTTASWSLGAGGGALDTGVIANNTGYSDFLIRRPDTGVVDGLVSLSATAPALPTNYTQFRRIGPLWTNSSGQFRRFWQRGDEFLWDTPQASNLGGSLSATATLTGAVCPVGVQSTVRMSLKVSGGTGNMDAYTQDADVTGSVAGEGIASWLAGSTTGNVQFYVRTNTSGQLYIWASSTGSTFDLYCIGFIDRRGRDD